MYHCVSVGASLPSQKYRDAGPIVEFVAKSRRLPRCGSTRGHFRGLFRLKARLTLTYLCVDVVSGRANENHDLLPAVANSVEK